MVFSEVLVLCGEGESSTVLPEALRPTPDPLCPNLHVDKTPGPSVCSKDETLEAAV